MFFFHHIFFSVGELFYASYKNLKVRIAKKKLNKQDIAVLQNLFPYYAKLNQEHKQEFYRKSRMVYCRERFSSERGVEISDSRNEAIDFGDCGDGDFWVS